MNTKEIVQGVVIAVFGALAIFLLIKLFGGVSKAFGSVGDGLSNVGDVVKDTTGAAGSVVKSVTGQDNTAGETELTDQKALDPKYVTDLIKGAPKGKQVKLFPIAKIEKDAKNIYKWLENKIITKLNYDVRVLGTLNTYKTKSQVSQLAEYFQKNFNEDLAAYIAHGMSERNLKILNKRLSQMPEGVI